MILQLWLAIIFHISDKASNNAKPLLEKELSTRLNHWNPSSQIVFKIHIWDYNKDGPVVLQTMTALHTYKQLKIFSIPTLAVFSKQFKLFSIVESLSVYSLNQTEKLMPISTFYYWKYLYYFTLSPFTFCSKFRRFNTLRERRVSKFLRVCFNHLLLSSLFILKVFPLFLHV